MSDKDFRQAFNKALKTEKELLKYYRKYFVKHTVKLQKLYTSHINSLKNIDGSIGGLNSMNKIFQENIPNGMKKKNISKKEMEDYLDSNNMKLDEYIVTSNTSMIDFVEQHIKKQIKLCMGDIISHNSEFLNNIKDMHVVFIDKDDDEKMMAKDKDIKKGELYFLGLIKRKKKIEGANILNKHNLIIKLVFVLHDGGYVSASIPHKNNFKIVKDETYAIVKKLISSTLTEEKRMSVKEHLKKQDEIVKTMIFEEQKKQLEEQLQNIEKDKDNKKVLLNIVKRINQASEIKLEDDPYYRQQQPYINYGINGRRLNNNSNNLLNRQVALEITKPLSKEQENNNNNNTPNFKININNPLTDQNRSNSIKQLEDMFGTTKKSKSKSKKKSGLFSSSKKSKKKN